MDCTKQRMERISMRRIQDYEIFTRFHSASFKTGTENIFPIGKFTTNNRVATTSIFNVQAPHSSAHGLFSFTEHGSIV